MCVECVADADCAVGETCGNNQCSLAAGKGFISRLSDTVHILPNAAVHALPGLCWHSLLTLILAASVPLCM
jgi:hypothetical protein